MKFNWGTGIFLVLTVFILAIIFFYIYITNLDIKLVEDNYYEKELVYQERIDKIKNTSALSGKIRLLKEPGVIILQFPHSDSIHSLSGSAWFYRPSDPDKDFTVPLQLNDSSSQVFDVSKLDKGKWMLKLEWEMGGKEYYYEEGVIIEH
jgi:hypothetical protein